jgi:hypothetical protein
MSETKQNQTSKIPENFNKGTFPLKKREYGGIQPFIKFGPFNIRLPFIHHEWSWTEFLAALFLGVACLGAGTATTMTASGSLLFVSAGFVLTLLSGFIAVHRMFRAPERNQYARQHDHACDYQHRTVFRIFHSDTHYAQDNAGDTRKIKNTGKPLVRRPFLCRQDNIRNHAQHQKPSEYKYRVQDRTFHPSLLSILL